MDISNKTEEVAKLSQLMSVSMISIYQEICKLKEDEHQINNKLMWCSSGDKLIESKTQAIRNLEYDLGKVKPHLPTRSIPRTSGFFHLTQKDAETPVVAGYRKRCQNRLKKDRIDLEYLEQVQEELLFSKKSDGTTLGGTQELNDVMESLVHKIHRGNINRAEETKFFHEIRKLEETREKYIYTAPKEPSVHDYWNRRVVGARQRWANENKAMEHKIIILLNDIEEIKRERKAHRDRVILLKAELEHVRKNIKCMEREPEKITSKITKAYKCAYELRKQMKTSEALKSEIHLKLEEKYSFTMYHVKRLVRERERDVVALRQVCDNETSEALKSEMHLKLEEKNSFNMYHVKQLVQERDVVALRRVRDKQLEEFMRQWSTGKVFPDDYEWAYENVDSNRMKELGEQTKEAKSSCSDYQSLMTYVKKLVREGDVVALRQVCDKQVDEFLRQWSNSELFLDD